MHYRDLVATASLSPLAPQGTVFLLSGWKGSGKDTTAAYLAREYGVAHLSIAKSLKSKIMEEYGLSYAQLNHAELKEMPLRHLPIRESDRNSGILQEMVEDVLTNGFWTPRALCILEGAAKRAVNPNYWVDQIVRQIGYGNYVISDVRFRTEMAQFKHILPKVCSVRVNRLSEVSTKDASERDLDYYKFDHVIWNTGSLNELHEKLDSLMRQYNVCT